MSLTAPFSPFSSSDEKASEDSSAALTVELGPCDSSFRNSSDDWGTASGGAAELPMEAACFFSF